MLPTIRVLNPEDNMKKFTYSSDVKDITTATLSKFIDDFLSNKLVASLKSQEIPADNTAPVKIIVGTQFEEIVLNPHDDVLVKYYAPWCGHCKKLAPIWD